MLRDVAIGYVRPAIDADSRHVRVSRRDWKPHVRHENRREGETLRRAETDLLHGLWSGVGVENGPWGLLGFTELQVLYRSKA